MCQLATALFLSAVNTTAIFNPASLQALIKSTAPKAYTQGQDMGLILACSRPGYEMSVSLSFSA